MKKFNIIILVLIVICYILDFSSVNDINDKHTGYVLESQFYGCWDGEDDNGNPTGGSLSKVKVIYLDKRFMLRYDEFVTFKDNSVWSKLSFEDCGNSLNLTLGFLIIIALSVNTILLFKKEKIIKEN